MVLSKEDFPKIYQGLVLMSVDNGMTLKSEIIVADPWISHIKNIELQLGLLTEDELETFIWGEETEMLHLADRCPLAHEFFNDAFEGKLSQYCFVE